MPERATEGERQRERETETEIETETETERGGRGERQRGEGERESIEGVVVCNPIEMLYLVFTEERVRSSSWLLITLSLTICKVCN